MAQPMAATNPTNDKLKSMLRRIKFSYDDAKELVTRKFIDSIEEIKTLTQDCFTRLCSIIRKPGGGTGGHVVSEPAEIVFHILVYYCQH